MNTVHNNNEKKRCYSATGKKTPSLSPVMVFKKQLNLWLCKACTIINFYYTYVGVTYFLSNTYFVISTIRIKTIAKKTKYNVHFTHYATYLCICFIKIGSMYLQFSIYTQTHLPISYGFVINVGIS